MSGIKGTTLIAISVVCVAVIGLSAAFTMGLFDSDDGEKVDLTNGTFNLVSKEVKWNDYVYYGNIEVTLKDGNMSSDKNITKILYDDWKVTALNPNLIDRGTLDPSDPADFPTVGGKSPAQILMETCDYLDGWTNDNTSHWYKDSDGSAMKAYCFYKGYYDSVIWVTESGLIVQWNEKVDGKTIKFILEGWERQ